ncbi:ADP-ribosylation factor family-domain-containing protein [Mycena leptocephala]|nr:ADP-ribosylation factor family-domain-containing protein [Mycena leptocephala]
MSSTLFLLAAAGADFLGLPMTFEIMMVGLDNAGKTSILHRFKHREPTIALPRTETTIGYNVETISYRSHNITIKDFGGDPRVRRPVRCYYWNAYAFVFVVDATAPERFPEAKEELFYLHNDGTTQAESHPLLVLANKMDLPGAADLTTISAALGVDEVSRVRKLVAVKGISAVTGEGFDEVLEWISSNVSHRLIVQHDSDKAAELIRTRGY